MKEALQKARLYAICDLGYLSFANAVAVSRQLLRAGAGILQLRAKNHQPHELVGLARDLKSLCDEFSIPLIINDHLELAVQSGAHGLHLGQDDGVLAAARESLGEGRILGRSTHSLEQARAALLEGADYIGFGPLFPTPTKKGRPAIGLTDLGAMEAEVGSRIPAFCIGGIDSENLGLVLESGAKRVVVVSHLLKAAHPEETTLKLIKQFS